MPALLFKKAPAKEAARSRKEKARKTRSAKAKKRFNSGPWSCHPCWAWSRQSRASKDVWHGPHQREYVQAVGTKAPAAPHTCVTTRVQCTHKTLRVNSEVFANVSCHACHAANLCVFANKADTALPSCALPCSSKCVHSPCPFAQRGTLQPHAQHPVWRQFIASNAGFIHHHTLLHIVINIQFEATRAACHGRHSMLLQFLLLPELLGL